MANKEDSRKSISCDYPITHRRTASSGNDLQQYGIQRQRDDSDGCETISTIGSTPRNDKSPTQLTGFPAIPKFGTELPAVTEWRKTLTKAKFRKDDTASLLSLDRVPGSWKRRRIIVAVVVVAIILVLILIAVGIYLGVAKPRSVHTHRKGSNTSETILKIVFSFNTAHHSRVRLKRHLNFLAETKDKTVDIIENVIKKYENSETEFAFQAIGSFEHSNMSAYFKFTEALANLNKWTSLNESGDPNMTSAISSLQKSRSVQNSSPFSYILFPPLRTDYSSNETFKADLQKSAELITANSTTFSESIIVAKDQVVLDYFNKTRNAAVHVIDESQVNASQIADSIVDTIPGSAVSTSAPNTTYATSLTSVISTTSTIPTTLMTTTVTSTAPVTNSISTRSETASTTSSTAPTTTVTTTTLPPNSTTSQTTSSTISISSTTTTVTSTTSPTDSTTTTVTSTTSPTDSTTTTVTSATSPTDSTTTTVTSTTSPTVSTTSQTPSPTSSINLTTATVTSIAPQSTTANTTSPSTTSVSQTTKTTHATSSTSPAVQTTKTPTSETSSITTKSLTTITVTPTTPRTQSTHSRATSSATSKNPTTLSTSFTSATSKLTTATVNITSTAPKTTTNPRTSVSLSTPSTQSSLATSLSNIITSQVPSSAISKHMINSPGAHYSSLQQLTKQLHQQPT